MLLCKAQHMFSYYRFFSSDILYIFVYACIHVCSCRHILCTFIHTQNHVTCMSANKVMPHTYLCIHSLTQSLFAHLSSQVIFIYMHLHSFYPQSLCVKWWLISLKRNTQLINFFSPAFLSCRMGGKSCCVCVSGPLAQINCWPLVMINDRIVQLLQK